MSRRAARRRPGGTVMQDILQRFIGFDRLLGPVLVKIIYYMVSAGIVLGALVGVLLGIMSLFAGNFSGLVQIIAAPVVAAVALVYWRFLCELFILAFQSYERLGEIRDRLPPNNYPQF